MFSAAQNYRCKRKESMNDPIAKLIFWFGAAFVGLMLAIVVGVLIVPAVIGAFR